MKLVAILMLAAIVRPAAAATLVPNAEREVPVSASAPGDLLPPVGKPDFSAAHGLYENAHEGSTGQTWYWGKNIAGIVAGHDFGPTNTGYTSDMFQFDLRHDAAQVTKGDFLRTLHVRDVVDGTGWSGGRIVSLCELLIEQPSAPGNSNRNYQCGALNTHVESGDGGAAPDLASGKGAVFGFGAAVFLHAGAVNLLDDDNEVDDYAQEGTSVALKSALGLIDFAQTRGSVLDAGLRISAAQDPHFNSGAPMGWKDVIALTDANGHDPFGTDSVVMAWRPVRTQARRTISTLFDFRGMRFSSAILDTDFVRLTEKGLDLLAPGAGLQLTNGRHIFQIEGSTSADALRVLATGSGELMNLSADGDLTLPSPTSTITAARIATKSGTPASSHDACTPGQIWSDAAYLYVCVGPHRIRRVALSDF